MPTDIEVKVDYLLNHKDGRKILDGALSYLMPLISDLSERRLTLGFTPLFLVMVMSGEYAAERLSGSEPQAAYEAVLRSLREVCDVASRLLRENWENGSLEELYRQSLESISSGSSGSEQGPSRNDRTQPSSTSSS
ncbi:hypothetical protein [Stetteria hydrogenophila]